MAVAAYASLLSLTHVVDNLHYRARFHLPGTDLRLIKLLQRDVGFLLEFVELYSENKSLETKGFWSQLAVVAFEAEESIIFHVCNLLHKRYRGETSDAEDLAFCETEVEVIQKIWSIKKEVLAIKEEGEDVRDGKQLGGSAPAAGLAIVPSRSQVVVGIEEHVITIMEMLTRGESNLKILPIVGMGGIGKTTLAKTVYEHPTIVGYFDICFWLTISQKYNTKQILMDLLGEGVNEESCDLFNLGDRLYKTLFGRRYLIVMDDVWTIEIWNELQIFFPRFESGSCIILTTRLSDMAADLDSYNPYLVTFLDDDKSWDLFCQNAFAQKGCPYRHLERAAREISGSCKGLPLEIVVIARLLASSDMTPEYWEEVEKNIRSLANFVNEDHCKNILSLSYSSLPIQLKLCFLHLRVFPEDAFIDVQNLINSWIVEGFIKPIDHKCLEEIAREYLKTLIDRNLLFQRNIEGMCGIHDLLLDFCVQESKREQFIQSPKVQHVKRFRIIDTCCLLCSKAGIDTEGTHLAEQVRLFTSSSVVSTVVCEACKMVYSHITRPSLVGTVESLYNDGLSKEILQPVEVRYTSISFTDHRKLVSPSKLPLLWNLQTLAIDHAIEGGISLPPEIWEMPQLRHITCESGLLLADPIATHTEGEDFLVLNNLQTLSVVLNFKCSTEILVRIPNLKNLNIHNKDADEGDVQKLNYSLSDLEHLQKLESLDVKGSLMDITFPMSLKQLHLSGSRMTWDNTAIIGSLLNLETLKLTSGVEGREWNPVEGQFRRLKELHIGHADLVYWRADSVHFPVLERLELENLNELEEIPSNLGDIATLQSIKLDKCSNSAINSAKTIWEEQHSMANEIRINVSDDNGMFYQIGPFTARMTPDALESLAYLKENLDRLREVAQHGRNYLNTTQMRTLKEGIHFLRDFVKVHCRSKIHELGRLKRQIVEMSSKADDVIKGLQGRSSRRAHFNGRKLLADVQNLSEIMDSIKMELLAIEEREDDEAGYDNGAGYYDIDSVGSEHIVI